MNRQWRIVLALLAIAVVVLSACAAPAAGPAAPAGEAGSEAAAGDSDDAQNAEELARETLAQTFSDMANQALGDSLRIPPTISVSQGERMFVFVRQDLDFSAMYEDPVTEALKEIRRERGLN